MNGEAKLWEEAGRAFDQDVRLARDGAALRAVFAIVEECPDLEPAIAIIARELGIQTPAERVAALRIKATPSPEDDAIKEAMEP